MLGFLLPIALWIFLMRDFIFGHIPVNMDTNAIYGGTKFYFNNLLNGVLPLWNPFVSLGRHYYAIAIINLFNPVTQLVPLLKLAGMNYENAFVVYMAVYFFIGCAGFYFLTLEVLKDRYMAYLAYLGMMFSSLGASMFNQFTFLELEVPAIWFFYFLLRFGRHQTRGHFVGLSFTAMVLVSSYLPFYFMTVFLSFLSVYVLLYFKEARKFCVDLYRFLFKHWRLFLLAVIGVLLAAAPIMAYKKLDSSGDLVAPGRHCQYSSAQQCYDQTMGRQGGMAYEEIARSGTLGERVDMQYLFGHLDKISYGSDSLLFLPLWVFVLLGLSFFLQLQRLTVLLSATALIIGLIASGNAAGLLGLLYRHIFFFAYFRNIFFLGGFIIPIVILLGLYQLQMLLNAPLKGIGAKKLIILGVVVVHALMIWFLKHYQGVAAVSYVTLGISASVFIAYFSGLTRLSPKTRTGVFALLMIVQPAWLLHAYALNAKEFASAIPSSQVIPVFNWVRPMKPAVNNSRIYQFVPYEDQWYEMSMTDAPPIIGYPQTAIRWTFDLAEHTLPRVLADYARYKIILYDDLNSRAKPVASPSPQLLVDHFDVNTLRLKTDFPRPQILVYNDSYTTSWKAYIDENPVELFRANGAFKGVKVPEGGHTVEFAYHPPGGRWVYVAATAALFAFLVWTVFLLYRENRNGKSVLPTISKAKMESRPFVPNIVWWLLLCFLLAHSVDWRLCTIERGRYLLGIFYNGYYQNASDGIVYRDYLKTHGNTPYDLLASPEILKQAEQRIAQ